MGDLMSRFDGDMQAAREQSGNVSPRPGAGSEQISKRVANAHATQCIDDGNRHAGEGTHSSTSFIVASDYDLFLLDSQGQRLERWCFMLDDARVEAILRRREKV